MEPKVTLMSWTNNPLETVYSVWEASKTEEPLRSPEEIREQVSADEVEELFRAVIVQKIPVGEHVDFVFMLEGVSVSFREQMVRHRIGTLPSPERVGVDIVMVEIPNLADSSWWSQSMRIQNMGRFATERMFRMPYSLLDANGDDRIIPKQHGTLTGMSALAAFNAIMYTIETYYNALVAAGVPMEDAREIIPLGAQHRISWKLNIGSLQHIVAKRGCWILQLGIWGPVIEGMINEVATKIHPVFRELVTPPCVDGDSFIGCVYQEECRRRLDGSDALPPCPLHLNHHYIVGGPKNKWCDEYLEGANIPMKEQMVERAKQYRRFWGRHPYTGKRIVDLDFSY
jgi:thymidylate synthase ThyX